MTIYHGPILELAAPHEQQRRLADAERARIARSSQRTKAGHLQRRRERVSSRGIRGCFVVMGWLVAHANRRAALVPSIEG